MTIRHFIDNAPAVALTATIDNATITVPVNSLIGFPTQFPYTATIDRGTASAEQVLVNSTVGLNLSVTRNHNGLGAYSHTIGALFEHTADAVDFSEANAHVNATTGVHGLTSAPVGTNDVQTLTNKTLAAPTLTGTAAAASITAAGTVEANKLIVDGTVALPSATPALQLGAQAGFNMQGSSRAIQAMNNAAVSDLSLNAAGGNVQVGGTGSAVTVGTASTTTSVPGNETVGGTLGVTGVTTTHGVTNVSGGISTDTVTASAAATAARVVATTPAALPSATPGLQVGAQGSTNLQFSDTTVQAVNNAVAANLNVNTAGGNVAIGNAASTVTVGHDLTVANNATVTGGLTVNGTLTTKMVPAAPTTVSGSGATTSAATELKDTLPDYTFTAIPGRRYRIAVNAGNFTYSVAGDRFSVRVRDGGASSPTTGSTQAGHDFTVSGTPVPSSVWFETTYVAPATTVTLGLFVVRLSGTGTATYGGIRDVYVQDMATA